MARIRIKSCSCIDFPCCSCSDDYALTGEDALEAIEEEESSLDDFYEIRHPNDRWTTAPDETDTDTPLGQSYGDGFELD